MPSFSVAQKIAGVLLLLLLPSLLLSSCGGEKEGNEQVAALAENREADPAETISAFVALATSGDREACQYLSAEYKKSARWDLDVPEKGLCATLFPDSPSKIKAQETIVVDKSDKKPKAISAVCVIEKGTLPDLPKNISEKERKELRKSFAKSVIQEFVLGPLVTEITFNDNASRWEMVTLPANTTFSKKDEKKAAKEVVKKVKAKC